MNLFLAKILKKYFSRDKKQSFSKFLSFFFIKKFFYVCCLVIFPFVAIGQFGSPLTDSVSVGLSVTCPNGVCTTSVGGCTNPSASNYNPLATYDDGSCSSPSSSTETVRGCMDPLASNYNVNATVDNGSCVYGIPNVSNFTAIKNNNGTRLTWTLPNFAQFSAVIIVKAEGRIPTSHTDGEVVYSGTGSLFNDNDISSGVTYYYLAITRNQAGSYSSGALTSYRDENIPTNILPPVDVPPPGGPGGGGTGGTIGQGPQSPFDKLPVSFLATSSEFKINNLTELFVFKQPGEKIKPFFDGGYIKLRGGKPFTVSVDYYKMPEVLKTIGITLYNAKNPNQSFSFLMKLNSTKTAYEATIDSIEQDGTYALAIYLINYQDQTVKKYNGQLAIVGGFGLFGAGVERFVTQFAGPVAVTGGFFAGLMQLLFASGHIGSFSDLYLLLLRQVGVVLGLLGLKKKNKPWGTVYDSVTKRPIDPAYVVVSSGTEEIATAITDIDGRYGFSLLDGNYLLKANKTHYQFPSSQLRGKINDEMYDNLYFGDLFYVSAGEVINKNIPLDPVDFDWNEFVKGKGDYFKVHTAKEVFRSKLIRFFYSLGFIMSIFYLIFYPSLLNIFIPILYLGINFMGRYWVKKHKVVFVKNAVTNEPMSFAIVKIFYADLDQEVKRVVSDMVGRFYLLVRPGTYYLTIDHKQPDGTYARIYKSPITELKRGIWEDDILI